MSEKYDSYFDLIIERVLDKFHQNNKLLLQKASFIIRKLCIFQDSVKVYTAFAQILNKTQVFPFSNLVELCICGNFCSNFRYDTCN